MYTFKIVLFLLFVCCFYSVASNCDRHVILVLLTLSNRVGGSAEVQSEHPKWGGKGFFEVI